MTVQETKVWDIFVRVFHWSLVLGFAIAYVTEEELLSLHVFAGYAVFGLILLRLAWGLIGSRYARFGDFIYRPKEIKQVLSDTAHLKARRYIGHNPAGGAMIVLMLASLLMVSVSGIAVYAAEESAGPLAVMASSLHPFEHLIEEVHEFFANLTLSLVLVHIAGVMFESLIHGENLVKSMVTGRKRV